MIIPRALHKSADAEKITIKLLVTDIYISNFSQSLSHESTKFQGQKMMIKSTLLSFNL